MMLKQRGHSWVVHRTVTRYAHSIELRGSSPRPAIALRGNAVVCESSKDPVGHFIQDGNLGSRPHGTYSLSSAELEQLPSK